MEAVTLYQFELCPFCHKVKAGLELKGIPFTKVEVNPMNKKELPPLPTDAPKKVPVLKAKGEIVFDSTKILNFIEDNYEGSVSFSVADEDGNALSKKVEQWVDDEFAQALPTVIYGTWGEAIKAAQVTARTSNFGFLQNISVRAGGSFIMHAVSKRILKKHNRTDGHEWVHDNLTQFEDWLADKDFVAGTEPSLGDAAMHGAITCVRDFPIFDDIMARPKTAAWFKRVEARRKKNAA